MDLRKLKTLIDLVSDSNVSELEITEAEGKVRIVKGGGTAAMYYQNTAPVAAQPAIVAQAATAAALAAEAAAAAAKPFVELGGTIREGETICIIEAMKILNEIEADKSGTVTKILCVNGQAVEYGQPMFEIT